MRWPRTAGSRSRLACDKANPRRWPKPCSVLADDRADRSKQLQFLQILGEVRQPACVPVVLRLACQSSDNALRAAALTTLAVYDDPAIAAEVIKAYARTCLMMFWRPHRACWSRGENGRSNSWRRSRPRRSIRAAFAAEDVEKLLLLGDAGIVARATKLFGPIKPATSAELHAQIDRLAARSHAGSGRAQAGQARSSTSNVPRCHTLFSKGGKVGPDLTTYRRDDLETMLLNIVNPSAEIREGYTTSIVAMTDGRMLSGVVVEEDKNVVVLRGGDGKEVALARADIDAIRPTRTSIMPEGLLNELSDQQVRDLFAYLRSTQPLID